MMLPLYLKKPHALGFREQGRAPDSKPLNSKTKFIKGDNFFKRYKIWKKILAEKLKTGSVIICFPQVSYLSKAREIIARDFTQKIHLVHSYLKPKELFSTWEATRSNSLILGTRVCLFHYPQDLGLIVIEEENNPCYFQEEKPFYHLQDVAFILSKIKNIDLIFGGDYPSLGLYKLIKEKKILIEEEASPLEKINLVNIGEFSKKKIINPIFVELLSKAMRENKRAVVLCNKTDKIEGILRKVFPEIKIDSWQNRKLDSRVIVSTSKILSYSYDQETFDLGLFLGIDFFLGLKGYDTTFKAFLYLKKLRSFFKDSLHVLTSSRDYYLFKLLNQEWRKFYQTELGFRKKLNLPPFGLIAKITLRSKDENRLLKQAQDLYDRFKQRKQDVHGPLKEFPFRLRDKFRYSLVVKTKRDSLSRKVITKEIESFRRSSVKMAVSLE